MIYRHAYRTFGCKHCTAVHEYVALARCGDRTCAQCRQVDYYRLYNAYAPQLVKLGKHGLKLVTLTQKNRESLEGVSMISGSLEEAPTTPAVQGHLAGWALRGRGGQQGARLACPSACPGRGWLCLPTPPGGGLGGIDGG